MKILFYGSLFHDFLSDSLLHGLRSLLGNDLIDFPKNSFLYQKSTVDMSKMHGKGFTLYKTLPDLQIDRTEILKKIKKHHFNYIVFGNIWLQWRQYLVVKKYYPNNKIIIIDGNDSEKLFWNNGKFIKNYFFLWLLKPFRYHSYCKRELTEKTISNYFLQNRLLQIPEKQIERMRIKKISFSIPAEKILNHVPVKHKIFPKHIVDHDFAENVFNKEEHPFQFEKDYYKDLQDSKFGITTKRSGWDCLRHYEIAANRSVICFKDLHLKPKNCAPHELNTENCIYYSTYVDLMEKIGKLTSLEYENLQFHGYKWIQSKTTSKVSEKFLSDLKK